MFSGKKLYCSFRCRLWDIVDIPLILIVYPFQGLSKSRCRVDDENESVFNSKSVFPELGQKQTWQFQVYQQNARTTLSREVFAGRWWDLKSAWGLWKPRKAVADHQGCCVHAKFIFRGSLGSLEGLPPIKFDVTWCLMQACQKQKRPSLSRVLKPLLGEC